MSRTVGLEKDMQTSLRSIAKKARKQKQYRFQNLYGMLDEHFLKSCFYKLNKKAASGVDGVTWQSYQENLNDNVHTLVERLKAKSYRARLVKRQYIPKGGGKLRPLGLPVLEDKLVQLAVSIILSTIWEQDFFIIKLWLSPQSWCENRSKTPPDSAQESAVQSCCRGGYQMFLQ
jgi:RNA-directed DNA polymerase